MLVSKDASTIVNISTAAALANTEARMRRISEYGDGRRRTATKSELERLEAERESWQSVADGETLDAWALHQRLYATHRKLAAEHADALKALGPAYVWRPSRGSRRDGMQSRRRRGQRNSRRTGTHRRLRLPRRNASARKGVRFVPRSHKPRKRKRRNGGDRR